MIRDLCINHCFHSTLRHKRKGSFLTTPLKKANLTDLETEDVRNHKWRKKIPALLSLGISTFHKIFCSTAKIVLIGSSRDFRLSLTSFEYQKGSSAIIPEAVLTRESSWKTIFSFPSNGRAVSKTFSSEYSYRAPWKQAKGQTQHQFPQCAI